MRAIKLTRSKNIYYYANTLLLALHGQLPTWACTGVWYMVPHTCQDHEPAGSPAAPHNARSPSSSSQMIGPPLASAVHLNQQISDLRPVPRSTTTRRRRRTILLLLFSLTDLQESKQEILPPSRNRSCSRFPRNQFFLTLTNYI